MNKQLDWVIERRPDNIDKWQLKVWGSFNGEKFIECAPLDHLEIKETTTED